jgi:hypothetical protein
VVQFFPDIWQERDCVWLVVRLGNPWRRAKNPTNLLGTVAILPENILQHYLCKAVLITLSSSPVYQYGKYGILVGWVVMRARV